MKSLNKALRKWLLERRVRGMALAEKLNCSRQYISEISKMETGLSLAKWEEMCFIKSLFWSEDDCVIQYHPPKSDYVNNHQYCLHMWRPIEQSLPTPPSFMVGKAGAA